MEQFYSWIQAIIFYMIFMNFMTNLLPGKAYARYVRLFMGMVLILLGHSSSDRKPEVRRAAGQML